MNKRGRWIEGENGDVWIPTRTAAKMLSITQQRVRNLHYEGVIKHARQPGKPQSNLYLLSEIETLAREPKRINKIITREDRQEGRLIGDPAKIDATFMTGKEAQKLLGTTGAKLSWYVNHQELTCYQRVVGRSPHLFDPVEVRILRNKRERLKRVRAARSEYREWDRQQRGKPLMPRPKATTLTLNDLKPDEQEMGEWITVRQTAAILEVCITSVYLLRQRVRLYGERRPVKKGWKRKLFQFRKADVLALRDSPEYQQGRAHYERHCSPLAVQIKNETRIPASVKITVPDVGTPISAHLMRGGGDW